MTQGYTPLPYPIQSLTLTEYIMNDNDPTYHPTENFGNVEPGDYRRQKVKRQNSLSDYRTILERRGPGWDWLNIELPNGQTFKLFIAKAVKGQVTVGVQTERDIKITKTLAGG